MKNILRSFLPLFFPFLLMSCHSALIYHMDILHPGGYTNFTQGSTVILVDNAAVQPANIGHIMSQDFIYKNDNVFSTESLSQDLLKSLSIKMTCENFYKQIQVSQNIENKLKKNATKSFLRATPLSKEQVKVLGNSSKSDVLISLDRLFVYSITNAQPYDDLVRATRDVIVNTVWRVYDLKADTLLKQFQLKDSLYWESFSPYSELALRALPVFKESLPEISDVVASHTSTLLGPYWESVERNYFCSGSFRMKVASDCLRSENWDKAAEYWHLEIQKGSGKSVYRAAMNLMLYFEFIGDSDTALLWAEKAGTYMSKNHSKVNPIDVELLKRWSVVLQKRSMENKMLKALFVEN